jgi:asparagine synthase (glutamine-hydrolysing)
MCGIAGIYAAHPDQEIARARLAAMVEAQRHRGPDGSGLWQAPGVALGHCRLAVIDPLGSPQPLHAATGDLTITFNGEIYNFAVLRKDLIAKGHHFHTLGDTEVIVNGYRQWGVGLLARLSGMFAFALYDHRDKRLLLARDRLGVKPLHYAVLPNGSLAFASELKGLLVDADLPRRPSLHAIEDFFTFGYVPDDSCFVADVHKLPAGSYLLLDHGKSPGRPMTYWDIEFVPDESMSSAELESRCRDHVRQAVRSRMVADVPLGAFLSGGVDSSAVVAFMAEASPQPVESFSIGFEGPLDETRYADHVAELFQTHHHSRRVNVADFRLIDPLVAMFDEPFADASALPLLRLCQLARERVTVALSGDGADEVFAGYRRHVFFDREEAVRTILPQAARRTVFGWLGRHYPKADWAPRWLRAKATFQALAHDSAEAYARAVAILTPEIRQRLFTDRFRAQLDGYRAEDRYLRVMSSAPAADALGRAQYADLKIWLPGDILTKVDRVSMSQGLEVREPMLDADLLAFAARLKRRDRVRGRQGKSLMKRSLAGMLPDALLYRPKMGFVGPISDWFRGALADRAAQLCRSEVIAGSGWFSLPFLESCVQDHRAGRADHGRLLWQLLMFDRAFSRLFMTDNAPQ